jgi:hypothetical protein
MVIRNSIIKTLLLLSCFVVATESFAQSRVALVIGNSDYQEQSLRNPTNDARDISKALRSLGFKVDLKLNASQEDMEGAVQRFGKKLQGNTVGLFYYSGHGVQYEGRNYLIPIGAMSRVSAPEHLRYKTVDAGYVLGVMKQAGNGLNIVVLDACRNNPFKSFSRSMNKGLKRISGAEGTIIAYSTSPGKVALDGGGRNSPYTEQLIKLMKKPNLPVEIMFKQVRKGVKSETGGKQSPWYEASIDGDFYFTITSRRHENYLKPNIDIRKSEIISLVTKYIKVSNDGDIPKLLSLYADNVDYFGVGTVAKSFIYDDKRNYYKRWPIINNKVLKQIEVTSLEKESKKLVSYLISFDAYSPYRNKGVRGVARNTIIITNKQGNLLIVSDKQKILNKEKY